MNLWWISFVDEGGFRGVAIVDLPADVPPRRTVNMHGQPLSHDDAEFIAAVQHAHALGCNPGGEAQGMWIGDAPVPSDRIGRLLNKEEADALAELMLEASRPRLNKAWCPRCGKREDLFDLRPDARKTLASLACKDCHRDRPEKPDAPTPALAHCPQCENMVYSNWKWCFTCGLKRGD